MGRHSAPDDDEPDGSVTVAPETVPPETAVDARGRHVRGEDAQETGPVPGVPVRPAEQRGATQDEHPTTLLALDDLVGLRDEPEPPEQPAAPVEAAVPAEPPAAAAEPAEPPATEPATARPSRGRAAQATGADLALIRRHADVRNRVMAGVLAPFLLYVIAMVVLSASAVHYLLWAWIPLVTAGVLVGFVLDSGHKRHPGTGPDR